MDELAQRSPTRIVNTPVVQITPVKGRALLRVRSWLPRQAQSSPIVLGGREFPSQVSAMLSGTPRVLCLAPQEWLIVSEDDNATSLSGQLAPDLARQGLVLVDLSDGLAILDVQGPAARELLSKGCGLDLHPCKFPAGHCARTRFAQIPLTIACSSDTPRFELYAGRSYAPYLRAWLTDAAVTLEA